MRSITLWLLFLHVAAALWITAGVFGSTVVRAQVKRVRSATLKAMGYRLLWRLHVIYTLPGLVISGFLGFYLVTATGFRFSELWVMASSLLYLLMFLWTLFAVTPALARARDVGAAAAEATGEAPELDVPGLRLAGILSDVNALVILLLVFLMVVKP
ncbi:MAG TPA: DUF2269 family protein [Thermoanaerobaculia bacterium]|nr:DUF2269 family protein [Thermoanaerobaculia bacterium]